MAKNAQNMLRGAAMPSTLAFFSEVLNFEAAAGHAKRKEKYLILLLNSVKMPLKQL